MTFLGIDAFSLLFGMIFFEVAGFRDCDLSNAVFARGAAVQLELFGSCVAAAHYIDALISSPDRLSSSRY